MQETKNIQVKYRLEQSPFSQALQATRMVVSDGHLALTTCRPFEPRLLAERLVLLIAPKNRAGQPMPHAVQSRNWSQKIHLPTLTTELIIYWLPLSSQVLVCWNVNGEHLLNWKKRKTRGSTCSWCTRRGWSYTPIYTLKSEYIVLSAGKSAASAIIPF